MQEDKSNTCLFIIKAARVLFYVRTHDVTKRRGTREEKDEGKTGKQKIRRSVRREKKNEKIKGKKRKKTGK